jgi:hypothetical protein
LVATPLFLWLASSHIATCRKLLVKGAVRAGKAVKSNQLVGGALTSVHLLCKLLKATGE